MRKITFSNVNEYMAQQPPARRKKLQELRALIKKTAPQAEEVISYQMPHYKFFGMLAFFCAFKEHYGLYIPSRTMGKFKERLGDLYQGKATIRLSFEKPLPKKLITEILKEAVKENLQHQALKDMKKKKKK